MRGSERADRTVLIIAAALLVFLGAPRALSAQSNPTSSPPSAKRNAAPARKSQAHRDSAATNRFSARVDVALSNSAASKGEWGLLIADAATGETLYALNEDRYFVPASNMKLFSTALA